MIELNLVVATIALVALLVAPARAPAETSQVVAATTQLQNALRFARDKAAQQRTPYGVRLSDNGRRARVIRIDPATNAVLSDVYHPLTKKLYRIDFGREISARFRWAGIDGIPAPATVSQDGLASCSESRALLFGPSGITRCFDPLGARIRDVGVMVVGRGAPIRLQVDSYSGRITRL